MKDGSADVKKHRWFREMKWDDVLDRKLKVKTTDEFLVLSFLIDTQLKVNPFTRLNHPVFTS